MNKAFVREPDGTAEYCPRCGTQGQAVSGETLRAHLAAADCKNLASSANFCPAPQCEVAYFDCFDRVVLATALAQPIYPKAPDAPLCACFGLRAEDIEQDVREGGGDADQGGVGESPLAGRPLHGVGRQRPALHCLGAEVLLGVPPAA